ncbi:MAG: hypothetical protein CM15mP125_4100 [Gammaproteobacteria bacterium]|nr:MAG: hypothetical protein CM15mP125_4100 [Gammaproteobacteria bacterium]
MDFGCRICRSPIERGTGCGAREWLLSQGHKLPDAPNQIVASGESGLVMSLSHREFWLLQPRSEASIDRPASRRSRRVSGHCIASTVTHGCSWQASRGRGYGKALWRDLSDAAFPWAAWPRRRPPESR